MWARCVHAPHGDSPMPVCLPRLALLGTFLALTIPLSAQPEPKPADPADDPLPDGAKLRFGVTRPILRTSPGVAILAPGFTNFVAPAVSGGVRRYDLGTGRPLSKV